ncbi:MAG: ERF family protein [Clostridium sp.]|uniref:ERF family protein n=1 Tax=Clostridium sp. TaxID=1506 RepID=UPI003EE480E3
MEEQKKIREELKGVYQKLHYIQTKVNGLKKNADSKSYKYVSGEKVLDHIKPIMNEIGLLLKPEITDIINDRMDYQVSLSLDRETGEWKGKPKSEILTKVSMRMTWIDVDTGETDVCLWGANGQNDWEKGLGSALTYGERYFLLKYFHIATDEDDVDNDGRKKDEASKQENKKTTTQEQPKEEKKQYEESDLDKDFLELWNKLSEDQRMKIGTKYPGKFGPQLNPQYFKKVEKREIIDALSNFTKKEADKK